jgi:4'-phosphopantetheinyl transferase
MLGLHEREVHLWQIPLAVQQDELQWCRRLLSEDENQRADRFYFDQDRRRFVAARSAMRRILSEYLNTPPQKLAFSYAARGKPELAPGLQESGIKFNLSHSSELALLAVVRGLTVGVDIELVNPEFATEEVAQRFFSAGEVNTLRALPPSARAEAFFSCWTRKEAYIKALGEGLSVPLDSFAVAFGPGVPAALLDVAVDPAEVSRWSMYEIETAEGYKAALVVEGNGHQLRQLQWEPEC